MVVNDLGGFVKGGDLGDANPAQEIVDAIRRAGGEAVADSNSVAEKRGAEAMVELALDSFGALHAVINPAGILRDKMFHKMGIVGLSRVIAMEGARKNVRSNVIAPFAWTRMIATIPVKDDASAERVKRMQEGMRADQVAQPVVAMVSDATKQVSGQIFAVRGTEIFLMS